MLPSNPWPRFGKAEGEFLKINSEKHSSCQWSVAREEVQSSLERARNALVRKRQELAETTPLLDRVLDCAELASTTSTQAIQVRAHASCGSEGKAKAAMHALEGSWSGADVELKALRLQFRVGLNEAETITE